MVHRVFFYLTLILLPTQLGFHFWPDWAMVLGRRLDYLSPTIFLTDITIISTLFFWFTSSLPYGNGLFVMPDLIRHLGSFLRFRLVGRNDTRNDYYLQKCRYFFSKHWYCWVLVIFTILNILLASSPIIAFSKWLKVLELFLFGLYIVKTKPSFSRSLWCLSVAVFYSSIIAITQFFLQHSIGGLCWFLGERSFDVTTPGIARIQILPNSFFNFFSSVLRFPTSELLRSYATFPHPNVLGGFLAIMLPLLLFRIEQNNKDCHPEQSEGSSSVVRRNASLESSPDSVGIRMTQMNLKIPFIWIILFIGSLALFLTFSRSAWISCVVFLVILKLKQGNVIWSKVVCYCEERSDEAISTTKITSLLRRLADSARNEKVFNLSVCKLSLISFFLSVGFVLVVGLFLLPYFQTLTPDSESVFVRNELNSSAFQMIVPNFLLPSSVLRPLTSVFSRLFIGVGLGNFLVELPKYYPHREIFFLQPVHNIYLLMLSETGIVGLLFFLWYILKTFLLSSFWQVSHRTRPESVYPNNIKEDSGVAALPRMTTYALFILLFLGLVDHYPLTLQQGQLLLTLLISFNLILRTPKL